MVPIGYYTQCTDFTYINDSREPGKTICVCCVTCDYVYIYIYISRCEQKLRRVKSAVLHIYTRFTKYSYIYMHIIYCIISTSTNSMQDTDGPSRVRV